VSEQSAVGSQQSVEKTGSQSFDEVGVWQKAHAFVLGVYQLTKDFPRYELFGLTSQMRRAAVSIPANFAEGFKKQGIRDKARFYNIAQGSIAECKYYLILTRDLGYGETDNLRECLDEVSRMLEGYTKSMVANRRPS
jgi:four helix bundle protein